MTAGTRGRTVIVNFPGSKKASAECFGFVEAALPHAVDLMRGAGEKVDKTHRELQHGKVGTCIYLRYVAADCTLVLRGFKLVKCLVREIREFLKRSKHGLQSSYFFLRAFMTLLYFVRIELFACAEGLGDTY